MSEKKKPLSRSGRVAKPKISNEVLGIPDSGKQPKKYFVDSSRANLSEKIIMDGEANKFPLFLSNLVSSSPTATRCLSVYERFVAGNDLSDPALWQLKVHPRQSFYDLHSRIVSDISFLRRIAIVVKWGAVAGQMRIMQLEAVPAKWVRYMSGKDLTETDAYGRLVYSPYMGDPDFVRQSKDIRYYYPYSADHETIFEQIRHAESNEGKGYVGQMLFWNESALQNSLYSVPRYLSAENDMVTDAELSFRAKAITMNSFATPSALIVQGDPDELVEDPDSYDEETGECTRQMRYQELIERRYSSSFSGENIGSTIILFEKNDSKVVRFEALPTPSNLWDFIPNVREDARKQILEAFGVPNVFANIATAGKLGDNQEIAEATKMMNTETRHYRYVIEQLYNELLSHFQGYAIANPIEIVKVPEKQEELPEWVINSLTPEEKRLYIKERFGI